jgi:hypothetical protein
MNNKTMKKTFFTSFFALLTLSANAQLQNGSFDQLTAKYIRVNNISEYSFLGLGQQTNDMIIADNGATKLYGGGYFFRVHNDSAPSQYVDALMIDDNGNVGIGGTKPTAKLDVNSTGQRVLVNYQDKPSVSFIPNNGNSWFHISHGLNNDLAISQGGNVDFQRLVTITNSGSVGIGISNPMAKLDVDGNVKLSGDLISSGVNGWIFHTPDDQRRTLHIAPSLPNGDFDWAKQVVFNNNGNVLINGKLEAKEVKVTLSPTADFVFEEKYDLPKLENIEKFIKENKHLPEVASAKEMEKEGVNVGEFQIKLLQKIEELTLYTIEQNKINQEQGKKIEELEKQLIQLNSKK